MNQAIELAKEIANDPRLRFELWSFVLWSAIKDANLDDEHVQGRAGNGVSQETPE